MDQQAQPKTLRRYLSPLAAWALALGCAVGWGSVVMPGTTFLPLAGPLGTALGMVIGAIIMFIIGYNYHFLMNRHPDAGGTMTYAIRAFGFDHGFLGAWFLMLVYLAIIWANATAIVLIARFLFGSALQWGFHYNVAGYDVYFGEVLLTIVTILISGFICLLSKRVAAWVQIVMAILLFGGVLVCIWVVFAKNGAGSVAPITPSYAPTGMSRAGQIINIIALTPWAFVGFESVSNSTQEFNFSPKRSIWVMGLALLAGTVCYVGLVYIAAAIVPSGYTSWVDYVNHLGAESGVRGLPTFFALDASAGRAGQFILGVTVTAGIVSGLIGNFVAASRLMYAMSENSFLPKWFGKLDKAASPSNAFLFLIGISLVVPFVGRAAIGWIVDVNTLGALIAYAYTSFAAFKLAGTDKRARPQVTGLIGIVVSTLLFLYFMVPTIWSVSKLSGESYLILIVWCILGFALFRYAFQSDNKDHLGRKASVWVALLFMIFFTTMLWLRESTNQTTAQVLDELNKYNQMEMAEHGVEMSEVELADMDYFLERTMSRANDELVRDSYVQMGVIAVGLFIMLSVFRASQKRELEMKLKKVQAEESSRAKTKFLSNMSHDIRTPMNAIIGYTELARKEKDLPPKISEYLNKIEMSSHHLLSLINDVLELSRVENDKMELHPERTDLVSCVAEVRELFATQMSEKGLSYAVEYSGVNDRMVLCDGKLLDRVLLNLISNAFKFTPSGGSVKVSLTQTGTKNGVGSYELRVRDTGMGMSPEFAATVFEAYTRDKSVSEIQGTGLGMAITKSIVELMGGDIRVESELGKGTCFIINVDFPISEETGVGEKAVEEPVEAMDFTGFKLLLVEDNEINREIATILLEDAGFELDSAENGREAVEKVAASRPGEYQGILMDIQMPIMDGYAASRAIRELSNPELASLPIIAMTANAFAEDVKAARDAGMDGHIAKPIDLPAMMRTLSEVLRRHEKK
ncbi:MAG: amino acid permease [Oscillospiraceae bacterium]|nr:amino acid permease [Oscillospiraceae bacterium]